MTLPYISGTLSQFYADFVRFLCRFNESVFDWNLSRKVAGATVVASN